MSLNTLVLVLLVVACFGGFGSTVGGPAAANHPVRQLAQPALYLAGIGLGVVLMVHILRYFGVHIG